MTVIINGDTGISGVNGSAANPAIKGSDADTGIHFGADSATITTGGTERVSVDSTGAATFSGTVKTSKVENANTSNGGVEIDTAGHVQLDGLQIPTAGALSNRNLIINGAMRVAQRGTSSISAGHATVDRVQGNFFGGAVTQSQGALTTAVADAAVYDLGFRHYFRQTNTTVPSGSTITSHRNIRYRPEGQDIATSGWNHTSSASFITLSFWVRSSVAQEFYGYIRSQNGTSRVWTFSTGVLAANTWTRIEKTIPGDSALEIPNDNTSGLQLFLVNPFWGSNYTDSSVITDTWRNYDTSLRTPDYTTTWVDTAGATFDMTGVQLEVGSKATPFEHESYGQTLAKCQRYYQELDLGSVDAATVMHLDFPRFGASAGSGLHHHVLSSTMRIAPNFSFLGATYAVSGYTGNPVGSTSSTTGVQIRSSNVLATNANAYLRAGASAGDFLKLTFDSEL